jgi:hypothetical protein
MKTVFTLTAAAAFAAFLILPFAAEITISVSFVATLALILTADYGRRLNRVPEYCTGGRSRESLRLAA